MSHRHLPPISLDPGEPLDPGLKQEISQQVRGLRAQKCSQSGCSPGHSQNNNQAARKAANKSPTEQLSRGPVSQSNVLPKQCPQGACDRKEIPRDRLLSPNQAAIQVVVSAEPKVKGQVQKPQAGPIPAVKPVSALPCDRSHSPCCRIDVDVVEPEYQGGWRKGTKAVSCRECLVVPYNWEAPAPGPDVLFISFPKQSFSNSCFYAAPCNSAASLQVPSNLQCRHSSHGLLSTSPTNSASCWDAVHSPASSDDTCSSVGSLSPHFSDDVPVPPSREPLLTVLHQFFVPLPVS